MKIIISEEQIRKLLSETIHPNEAHNDLNALMTVIEGKRGLCAIRLKGRYESIFDTYINMFDLRTIKIPSNPHGIFVVYTNGYEDRANELVKIAEKYNGYFSIKATKSDTIRMGELFEYDPEEIMKFIKEN